MSSLLKASLLLGAFALVSVLVTAVAAGFALHRPSVSYLTLETRSRLVADYSADPLARRLAPLSPEVIRAAAQDEVDLSEDSSVTRLIEPLPTATPAAAGPAPTVATTVSPAATAASVASPPAGPTSASAPAPTASSGALTPGPTPSSTALLPTFTPTPPPTNTPVPTSTPLPPTSTPMPTATPVPSTNTPQPTATPEDDDDDGGGGLICTLLPILCP